MKILLGGDVCRDLMLGLTPENRNSVARSRETAAIRSLLWSKKVDFFLSTQTLITLYAENSRIENHNYLPATFLRVVENVEVLEVNEQIFQTSISFNHKYISQAINLIHATEKKVDAIVTRLVLDYQEIIYSNAEYFEVSPVHILNVNDFLESVKEQKILSDKVKCYTPKGEKFELPRNSTPVDFAYYIHTKVGNHCSGVLINGSESLLTLPLEDNDTVEIITSVDTQTDIEWRKFAYSKRAIKNIKRFIKKKENQKLLNNSLKKPNSNEEFRELFYGISGKKCSLAGCCNPLPIDKIIGFISKDKVTIHSRKCKNVNELSRDNLIGVRWNYGEIEKIGSYIVGLKILAIDKKGVLARVASIFCQYNININKSSIQSLGGELSSLEIWIEIDSSESFSLVIEEMNMLDCIIEISRTTQPRFIRR